MHRNGKSTTLRCLATALRLPGPTAGNNKLSSLAGKVKERESVKIESAASEELKFNYNKYIFSIRTMSQRTKFIINTSGNKTTTSSSQRQIFTASLQVLA